VKTKNGVSYVQVLGEVNKLIKKEVKIGISDDTITEIISGLNEGDQVVVKTSTGTTTSSKSSSSSSKSGMMGGGPAMGGIMH
jgi:predicted nucleic acid-binding protein